MLLTHSAYHATALALNAQAHQFALHAQQTCSYKEQAVKLNVTMDITGLEEFARNVQPAVLNAPTD